ncbi:hypothetical protein MSG28_001083 [Choristoneura fumiferana]|uniref:Uncharacterized protein n=1 Tax=Choristoneura fumiferana TaxID=7141 RepID=A0ACC0K422_CHOFU|nr:hypothetical protein MSG28_001083 [Choristoneura fumiferana]
MPHSDFWPFDKCHKNNEDAKIGEPSILQKQLGAMEGEVKEIQMEIAAIKKDRLDQTRKQPKLYGNVSDIEEVVRGHAPYDPVPKYHEVIKLREELIRAKSAADEERLQREKHEEKLKELEKKLNDICSTDMVAEESRTSEEVTSHKIQLRDMREELEELRMTLNEKTEQLQEYRMRYLQAQQQVEEAKRQHDVIEFDNKQVSDQIQLEIQKMKMQFQEKLQELAPLPDLLKGAQIQLQEAKQMQKLAEDSTQQLSSELHRVREKLVMAVNSLNQEKADRSKLMDENKVIKITSYEKDKEIDTLTKELDEYKYKEKSTELAQLLKDFEELRSESNRSLSRCKERSESMRRYMQTQITELERQLIQSRAQCSACQKERDEIRQRMQSQINNLQESFELAEIRLRGLQNQVFSLKKSYSCILADENDEFNKITNS